MKLGAAGAGGGLAGMMKKTVPIPEEPKTEAIPEETKIDEQKQANEEAAAALEI